MIEPCATCNNTGRWPGYPKPCPECGAYLLREKPRIEKWEPTPRFVVTNPDTPNRKQRRTDAAKARRR